MIAVDQWLPGRPTIHRDHEGVPMASPGDQWLASGQRVAAVVVHFARAFLSPADNWPVRYGKRSAVGTY
jgi:hypothetical protein